MDSEAYNEKLQRLALEILRDTEEQISLSTRRVATPAGMAYYKKPAGGLVHTDDPGTPVMGPVPKSSPMAKVSPSKRPNAEKKPVVQSKVRTLPDRKKWKLKYGRGALYNAPPVDISPALQMALEAKDHYEHPKAPGTFLLDFGDGTYCFAQAGNCTERKEHDIAAFEGVGWRKISSEGQGTGVAKLSRYSLLRLSYHLQGLSDNVKLALETRKVQTPGGAKYFGQPIGTTIVMDVPGAKAVKKLAAKIQKPATKSRVEGSSPIQYAHPNNPEIRMHVYSDGSIRLERDGKFSKPHSVAVDKFEKAGWKRISGTTREKLTERTSLPTSDIPYEFKSYAERKDDAIAELKKSGSPAYEVLGDKIHGLGYQGAVDRVKAMDKIPRPMLERINNYFAERPGAGVYIGSEGVFSAMRSAPAHNSEDPVAIAGYVTRDNSVDGVHSLNTRNVYASSLIPDDHLGPYSIINHEMGHAFEDSLPRLGYDEFLSRFVPLLALTNDPDNKIHMDDYFKTEAEGFAQTFTGWVAGRGETNINKRMALMMAALGIRRTEEPRNIDEARKFRDDIVSTVKPILDYYDRLIELGIDPSIDFMKNLRKRERQ